MFKKLSVLLVLLFSLTTFSHSQTPISITTKSYDNARTSANTQETILTPANVKTQGMKLVTTIPVIGDARGEEAQPLVLSGLTINGIKHNLMVLPSMANVIRGVEASSGLGIWQTAALCTPIKSNNTVDMWAVNDHFGMLATGVIDPDTQKLYQIATCSEDGTGNPPSMRQRMFVIRLTDGTVLANTLIDGRNGNQVYSAIPRKQRSALLLTNVNGVKFIWFAAGSFSETGSGATGWLMGFDTYDNQIKIVWSSSQGYGAGIWMSGQGVIADTQGHLYLFTGNGSYNGTTNFGESIVQLQPTYPTSTTPGSIKVLASWARFSDAGRVGNVATQSSPELIKNGTRYNLSKPKTLIAGESAPSEMATKMSVSDTPGGSMPMMGANNSAFGDQDDGLSATLITKYNKYLGGGKDGVAVVLDTTKFPSTKSTDFANPKANCAKLAAGPYQLAWNLNMDSCPVNMTQLNIFPGGKTRHIHSPMVQYQALDGTVYILVWGENSPLQAWQMNADGTMSYVARSNEMASPLSTGGTGGMPGGFATLSSNNGSNPIVWASVPNGDANRSITTGYLYAYDLTNLSSLKGTGKPIPVIWKSDIYTYNKFMTPTVWNGQVYLPNYNGGVNVYGLNQ